MGQATKSDIMKKWEYRIIDSKDVPSRGILKGKSREAIEEHLNKLGAEGWEVVNLDALEFQGGHLSFLGLAKRERQ